VEYFCSRICESNDIDLAVPGSGMLKMAETVCCEATTSMFQDKGLNGPDLHRGQFKKKTMLLLQITFIGYLLIGMTAVILILSLLADTEKKTI
jgi:hypothetical protein